MNYYHYDKKDLIKAYTSLNLKKDDTIYITGSLLSLGRYKGKNILNDTYKILKKILGKNFTIAFPTHSLRLLNNKREIYDHDKTYSESGSLTEFLRKKKSFRQIHPFSSTAALGKNAKYICENNTKHVYGPDSPFERLINLKSKFISIGMEPRFCSSQVHHAEFLMKVPYRYIKKFKKKIKIKKKIYLKNFYLFSLKKKYYKFKRDRNKKIFNFFLKKNKIFKTKLGKNFIYSYNIFDFHLSTIRLMKKNIYSWLSDEAIKFYKLKS